MISREGTGHHQNMPEPRGLGFIMRARVDADHASDTNSVKVIKNWIPYIFELWPCILVEQEANIS